MCAEGFAAEEFFSVAFLVAIDHIVAAFGGFGAARGVDRAALIDAFERACGARTDEGFACRSAEFLTIADFADDFVEGAVPAPGDTSGGVVFTLIIAGDFSGSIEIGEDCIASRSVMIELGAVADFVSVHSAVAATCFGLAGAFINLAIFCTFEAA